MRDLNKKEVSTGNMHLCPECGGPVVLVRHVEGAYVYPVDPEGKTNITDPFAEEYHGDIEERYECRNSEFHDVDDYQADILFDKYDEQMDYLIKDVGEREGIRVDLYGPCDLLRQVAR